MTTSTNPRSAKKGIGISLSRDVYALFRAKLFIYGLSVQQVFSEFVRLVVTDSPIALNVIKTMSDVELGNILDSRELIEELTPVYKRKKKPMNKGGVTKVAGINVDKLYDLIDTENAKKLAEQKIERENENALEEYIQERD
jgi:hypothetical protein